MRTPPMGMSGVQVLGMGGLFRGCSRGPSQLYPLHQAQQEGTTTGRPLTPRQPPSATYSQSLFGDLGQLGAIIGSGRYAADAASGEGAVSKELGRRGRSWKRWRANHDKLLG